MDWQVIVTGAIFILTSVVTSVYFVTKLESSNKSNKEFFINALEHLRELVRVNECNNNNAITKEIGHLKEIMENNKEELKEDIGRLEKKQEESNKIKERLVIQEQSEKSLHKRVDRLDKLFDTNTDVA